MKCKVRLTHTVEMVVEAESEEAIQDWLNQTTPAEAKRLSMTATEEYSDDILCEVRKDTRADYDISKGLSVAGYKNPDEVITKAEPTVLKENNMEFSMVDVDFPFYGLERIEEKLARIEKKIAEEYVDLPCRIYLDKAPSEECRDIAEKIDRLNYNELCFFIEAIIGRDGLEAPWQKSDWKLFYMGSDGEHNLLAEGIELLAAFDFVKAGYEKMKEKAPKTTEQLTLEKSAELEMKYYVYGTNSMGSTWYLGGKDATSCTLWDGAPEEMRAVYETKEEALEKVKELDEAYKFGTTRHYIQPFRAKEIEKTSEMEAEQLAPMKRRVR